MSKSSDLEKTWKPGPAQTTTLNAPGSVSIPYGRYKGSITGRGAPGNAPNAATWNTNYSTNYNVAYPIANQPAATWNTNYNTNYNVAYPVGNRPIANQPAASWNTNYSVSYPVNAYPIGNPISGGNYNSPSFIATITVSLDCSPNAADWFSVNNNPANPGQNPSYESPWSPCAGGFYTWQGPQSRYRYYTAADGCSNFSPPSPTQCSWGCCGWWTSNYLPSPQSGLHQSSSRSIQFSGTPGTLNYTFNYNVEYGVSYPVANQPVSSWNTNYSTNYNVAYPIANQPIANQPGATWNTNYNTVYPVGNQPIANQPGATYNPATAGSPTNIFGVPFPGGDASNTIGSPNPAPLVGPTPISYWTYPDGTTQPVDVPSGGNISVTLE
jgi:hypothetical protein